MTWVKLTDDFSDQAARAGLSDAAFRMHVEGLGWTMRRETGGRIDGRDLRRFAETAEPEAAVAELVKARYWRGPRSDGSYLIVANMAEQAEPEVIAKRRANDAERQRRARRKAAGLDDDASRPESHRESRRDRSRPESRRDNPRDPGLGWSGLDGQTRTEEQTEQGPDDHGGGRLSGEAAAALLRARPEP